MLRIVQKITFEEAKGALHIVDKLVTKFGQIDNCHSQKTDVLTEQKGHCVDSTKQIINYWLMKMTAHLFSYKSNNEDIQSGADRCT